MSKEKIDSEVLQQMLSEGKSQKECAVFMSCSEAAISKRVKRLEREAPPESFERLAPKQKRFVLARLEGKSNTAAALDAYNCSTTESAHSIGVQLSHDPDIEASIHNLMHQEGIGRRHRVRRLRAVIDAKDLGIAAKGIEIANKMTGDNMPEKVQVAVAGMVGLSPGLSDAIDRLLGPLRNSQERIVEDPPLTYPAGLLPQTEAQGVPEAEREGITKEIVSEACREMASLPKSDKQCDDSVNVGQGEPMQRQKKVFQHFPDPYAPRTVHLKERMARAEAERRNGPVPEYDPLNR